MESSVNDNTPAGCGRGFGASAMALYLPVAVILAGYATLWVALWLAGRGDGAIARLCLAAIGFAAPFLLAHAVLRHATISVRLSQHALFIHKGFPSARPLTIDWENVRGAEVRWPPLGLPQGSGTLVVARADGAAVAVADLADAAAARDAILAMAHADEAALVAEMRGVGVVNGDPLRRAAIGR